MRGVKLCLTILSLVTYAICSQKRLLIGTSDDILSRLQALESEVQILRQQNVRNIQGGATFIRWGRTVCPANVSDIVYKGYAGGARYDESGGAADYLCLPPDPDLTEPDPHNMNEGNVWGAEFEGSVFAPDSHNKDVPCVVCRLTKATTQLMIPAKSSCYKGWTFIYSGHLASNYPKNPSAGQYVCVDSLPEYLPRGDANLDGKLFYPVAAKCGSLLCPPYKENYYLKCVVCAM